MFYLNYKIVQKSTANLKTKSNSKEIWDVDEVLASCSNGANSEDIYDPRPQPEYPPICLSFSNK